MTQRVTNEIGEICWKDIDRDQVSDMCTEKVNDWEEDEMEFVGLTAGCNAKNRE